MNSRSPCARSVSMARRAPALGSSPNASRASGLQRPSAPWLASSDTVDPSACAACTAAASGSRATPSSAIQRWLPSASRAPCTRPWLPRPATACTSSAAPAVTPRSRAASSTARASGCALWACKAAAACSTASSSTPATPSMRNSRGWPSVSVPVLSKATVSTRCAISSACASLIRMPCCAATPVPAMMAAGVARPSAQGQAITSTATACSRASSTGASTNSQPPSVMAAITSTTGTNTAATWSTRRCTGALPACASCTSAMMRASTLWAPTARTLTSTAPSPLSEPPVTASPGCLGTGMASPVSIDSSACVWPCSSSPSAGKRSPGSTRMTSPGSSSSTGTSTISVRFTPSGINRATSGRSACSARMALVVWRLARASSHLPSSTRVMTTADPS